MEDIKLRQQIQMAVVQAAEAGGWKGNIGGPR